MSRFQIRYAVMALLTFSALHLAGVGKVVEGNAMVQEGCANAQCNGPSNCSWSPTNQCCIAPGGGSCTTIGCETAPNGCAGG